MALEATDIIEALLYGVALSADAFAVSVCKGLAVGAVKPRHIAATGTWFGGFQAAMPILGFYLGFAAKDYIINYDHWAAFILLSVIGINMIRESTEKSCPTDADASFAFKKMFVLAIATSIDALAVGIAFAMSGGENIWLTSIIIGITTFILSGIGLRLGSIFGIKYKSTATAIGGIILILLGVKILLEHLGIINF
ncbi:MAG TPA: manganese efflux pump MntP family protein [Bacillota bacterium]|nr:manganese efflux pump [Clostridiales bacterium]HOQ13999.1 manganese efflux pump MntP family protein [Bacillota bacterium]